MKRFSKVLLLLLSASAGYSEDGLFLTLARTATPSRSLPTQAETITRTDIQTSGAHTLDEVLVKLTSAQIQRTGQLGSFSTLRLRGAPSSAQVQVLVDDVPLGGVSTQFVDLSQIALDDVERIEIVRGPSSVLYGANTLGGTLNIITRRSTEQGVRTNLEQETRSYFTQIYKGSMEAAHGAWNGRVTAGRSLFDGFQDNSDGDQIAASGNVGYSWGNAARINFDLSRVDSEAGSNSGTTVPLGQWDGHAEKAVVDPTGRVENASTRGRLNVVLPLGPVATWETTLYGFDQDFDYTSPTFFSDAERKNIVWGGDSRWERGGAIIGTAWERDSRKTRSASSGPFQRDHVDNTAVYAQKIWRVGAWSFLPALRWDDHSKFGDTVNPRLAIVYSPSETTKWSWSAARSFRAPDLSSLYDFFPGDGFFFGDSLPNPDLKPEVAWGYDAGLEKKTSLGRSVVSLFYTDLKDRIYFTQNPFPASNTTRNGPRAELSGVEASHDVVLASHTVEMSYTYLRALGNRNGVSHLETIRLSPRHTAWLRWSWALGRKWALINEGRYVNRQHTDDGDRGTKLPSYTLWNFSVQKTLLSADFVVGVDNITNKHYAATGSNFSLNAQPGRTYRASVKVRFND